MEKKEEVEAMSSRHEFKHKTEDHKPTPHEKEGTGVSNKAGEVDEKQEKEENQKPVKGLPHQQFPQPQDFDTRLLEEM